MIVINLIYELNWSIGCHISGKRLFLEFSVGKGFAREITTCIDDFLFPM
jgi:hypothetical protein